MIQVSKNVYVEQGLQSPNLGIITTKAGVVVIDTPMRPKEAVAWRDKAGEKGKLSYVINTEEHIDHWVGTWFLKGVLISSEEARKALAKKSPHEVKEMVKRIDPSVLSLVEGYKVRLADIYFSDSMELYLGDTTIKLFPMPGHTPGGIGVYLPEERVVFTADIIFSQVKSWFQEADPEKWLSSLQKIAALDADILVPGHGEICKKDYLDEQARVVNAWVDVIQWAIKQGMSKEEALLKVKSPDPYKKDPKVSVSEDDINARSIAHLYDYYTAKARKE